MSRPRFLVLILPLSLVLVAGCGSNKSAPAKVSGKITYQNAPVTGGTIVFHGADGGIYSCGILADGTYEGTDLPAGDLKVTIETESINPNRKMPAYGGKAGTQSPKPEGATTGGGTYVKIPPKYADKDQSGLTVTLAKGKQTKDFTLTD
jgi:hypothetical protein